MTRVSDAFQRNWNQILSMARKIKIQIPEIEESVTGIVDIPSDPDAILVLAHGAGAGMEHKFMQALSDALVARNIGVLRFNFPYMEKGGRRPDGKRVAIAALDAALKRGKEYSTKHKTKLLAAGKSFGGRMFSHLAAGNDSLDIDGLVFFGFPLHAPGKPGTGRAAHLKDVKSRMLFLQGTRDTLAQLDLIEEVVKPLRKGTLRIIDGADHGFHVLKRSGKTDEEIIHRLAHETSRWLARK